MTIATASILGVVSANAQDTGPIVAEGVVDAPANFPFAGAIERMWTVVYFEPVDAQRTRVRVVGLGFGFAEESQQMRAFFQRGNATTIEQLGAGLRKATR